MKKFAMMLLLVWILAPAAFAANAVEQQMFVSDPVSSRDQKPVQDRQMNLTSDLISVSFTNADIQNVLKVLALKGGVNVVAGPDVAGVVTIQLNDVTWKNAFETIVRNYGFSYEQDGNIYQVISQQTLQARAAEDQRTQIFTLEYATLGQVKDAMKKLISLTGAIESIPGTNQILVTDTSTRLKAAEQMLRQIDNKPPQVHIDARIVRTVLGEGEELGIDWNPAINARGAAAPLTWPFPEDTTAGNNFLGTYLQKNNFIPTGQTAQLDTTTTTGTGATSTANQIDFPVPHGFPFANTDDFQFGTLDFTQFTAMFKMIKKRKNTKIISNPRIVVVNHQAARIQVGGEVGIPLFERNETTGSFEVAGFEERNFGIVLNVTPHVTKKEEIMLDVVPEVTQFLGFEPIGGTNLASPRFDTIVAQTNVLVHSGDTLVIGGLISDVEDDERNKVPYLNRIPLVGWVFKSVRKSPQQNRREETIFFLTVSLADDVYNKESLELWKKSQDEYKAFQQFSEEEFFNKKKKK